MRKDSTQSNASADSTQVLSRRWLPERKLLDCFLDYFLGLFFLIGQFLSVHDLDQI